MRDEDVHHSQIRGSKMGVSVDSVTVIDLRKL